MGRWSGSFGGEKEFRTILGRGTDTGLEKFLRGKEERVRRKYGKMK